MGRHGLKIKRTALGLLFGVLLLGMTCESVVAAAVRGTADSAVIELLAEVEVEGRELHLADVARIRGGSDGLRQKLATVAVGNAPLPGGARHIKVSYLQLRLKQYHIDPAQVRFQGASEVTVRRGCVQVDEKKLRALVDRFMENHKFWDHTTVVVKDIHLPMKMTLPKGHITYRITTPDHLRPTGAIPLFLHFFVDGVEYRKQKITVRVELIKEVVVATHPIGRYKPIAREDIEVRKMKVTNLSTQVITDIQAVVGQRAKRHIYPETVLRADMIEYPPLVKRGAMVLIVAQKKGLRITAMGKAKKSGRQGDMIKVVNLDSRKTLYAKVVDRDTVRIEF